MGALFMPRESGGSAMRLVLGIIVAATMFVASAGIASVASADSSRCAGNSDNFQRPNGGVVQNHPGCVD
jgi:hypothetical protein